MNITKRLAVIAALCGVCVASTADAAIITIEDDSTWTQQENGFYTGSNNGLVAEAGDMWGISNNTANRQGIIYKAYSAAVSGSGLPATIQAGTYVLEGRIGSNGQGGNNWIGLNDISSSTNGVFGAVAGFFTTVGTNSTASKNNMLNEFISDAGVTYSVTAPDPADDAFATWTFTWDVAPGSAVIGSDPNLGFYVKTGNGGGNGFWDDSELTFTAIPEPTAAVLAALGLVAGAVARRR